jgi:tRNA U34 5-carboxymethylaminomethyl modifying GTPase MnmE/TrmE
MNNTMRQPEIIRIDGVEIVYLDFSGLKKKEDVIEQIGIFGSYIRSKPFNSQITLTNLADMHFNTDIYNLFVNYVKSNNPHVKMSAVIGLKGLMNIFYKGFISLTGRNVKVCSSKEEAVHVLVNSNETVEV